MDTLLIGVLFIVETGVEDALGVVLLFITLTLFAVCFEVSLLIVAVLFVVAKVVSFVFCLILSFDSFVSSLNLTFFSGGDLLGNSLLGLLGILNPLLKFIILPFITGLVVVVWSIDSFLFEFNCFFSSVVSVLDLVLSLI